MLLVFLRVLDHFSVELTLWEYSNGDDKSEQHYLYPDMSSLCLFI